MTRRPAIPVAAAPDPAVLVAQLVAVHGVRGALAIVEREIARRKHLGLWGVIQ